MRRRLAVTVALAVLGAAAAPAHAQTSLPAYVTPYGTNDAGGFRNVLPPGEAGVDNALQLAAFEAGGTIPPHWGDQQPLYNNLVYAAPTLTHAQIGNYYKDATFGVPTADITRVEQPEPGLTIVRDQYDVPHIYGQTRAEVEFGAGYAGAEDRLFLMDALRHTAEASLSSFVGGSAGNRAMDEGQWTVAPYTPADLQQQISQDISLYGSAGAQVVDDVSNFVAGINTYVDSTLINPNLLPAEYAAIGKLPTNWTNSDVLAEASLIGAIFGKGGGNEVQSALTEEAFEQRFGVKAGRAAWLDFREHNDPEAAVTVSHPFPYETGSPFSSAGLAMPDPGSVKYVSPGGENPDTAQDPRAGGGAAGTAGGILGYTDTPDPIAIPNDGSLGSALLQSFYGHAPHASNWELVNAAHSTTGHAIAVMGPQVGYYVPQILLEEDLHGPGFDARGASFPGVNLYVELGHGRDYAWSATTATSDNVDTFAEVLCQDDFHYVYKGQCLPMQALVHTNSWTPNVDDHTAPGSETLTTYRTVHGLVFARGTVGGQKVAFVSARTTYFHEADSALGFSELNDPSFLTSPQAFQQAASNINFGFNWAYVDANHIAYYESGWFPQRAAGTSPDFPIFGTGQYDWKGFDPSVHTEQVIPYSAHPQAVDPTYLVSWNNKQAPQWSSADDQWGYGDMFRSQLIEGHIQQDLAAGGGKMDIVQLIQSMDLAATEDIRMVKIWPLLRQVLGTPSDPQLQNAMALLDQWYADGGHRWDLQRTGTDSDNRAIEIMDAWWPLLLKAEFEPTLGETVFGRVQSMIGFGGSNVGGNPRAPDFAEGWYGYVSKDLRDLLAAQTPSRATSKHRHHCKAVRRHGRRVFVCSPKAGKRAAVVAAAKSSKKRRRAAKRQRAAKPTPRSVAAAIPGAYSQIYCGGGSLSACRTALQQSLLAALAYKPAQLYGKGHCASNPQPSCFDENQSVIASAISMPPFVFQNRPTFQQVVEVAQVLPR